MLKPAPMATASWAAAALGFSMALASNVAHAGPTDGCTPTVLTAPAPKTDICYGTASWKEPTLGGKTLQQRFDFYAATSSKPTPLVIWAHPNGMSKNLPVDKDMYKALVTPALAAGFSLASIEFRHPVVNQAEAASDPNGKVPHWDVARALQYIRANAKALNVDPENIFFAGQSRGTLTLWTALQDDMAQPNSSDVVAQQSTRVNAVFAVQAQTTYDGIEFDSLFILPRDQPTADADFIAKYPNTYTQFGSAIKSVNAGVQADPPVKLRYDAKPSRQRITYEQMMALDYIHYPDFGLALCNAYLNAFGNLDRCIYHADTAYADNPLLAFQGYINFFKQYRVVH